MNYLLFLPLIMAPLGGLIYRIRGGLIPGVPISLSRVVYSLPFAAPCVVGVFMHKDLPGVLEWTGAAVLVFLLTWAMVATGHGEYQGYKEPLIGTPEKEDFVFRWFAKGFSPYWYKFTGMFLNGWYITVFSAIAATVLIGPWAFLLDLGGMMKGVAYAIGWKIYPKESGNKGLPGFNQPTQIGEFLTGFFAYAALGIVVALLVAA